MSTYLLEIQPEELKFIYELKKQSSCSVQLINNSHQHVAFKVKTTAPKKYCVRPNIGVITPKSTCEFTVIMQAQVSPPADLVCKDKFLVQSTIVSVGTTNEDLTRDMFVKGGDKYIEERKLRVSLSTQPHSPILSPMNGKLKQGPGYEALIQEDQVWGSVEIITPKEKIAKDGVSSKLTSGFELNSMGNVEFTTKSAVPLSTKDEKSKPASDAGYIQLKNAGYSLTKDVSSKPVKNAESSPTEDAAYKPAKEEKFTRTTNTESLQPKDTKTPTKDEVYTLTKDAESMPTKEQGFTLTKDAELTPTQDAELRPVKGAEVVPVNDVEKLEFVKNIEELKLKLVELESKLSEAEATISKLDKENRLINQDSRILQKELEWRTKRGARQVKEGFPLLFVCMVALVCIVLGYRLHPGK